MKKRLFISLTALVAGVILTGCGDKKRAQGDPAAYSYYVWINGSSHQITLSSERAALGSDGYGLDDTILNPGEKHEGVVIALPPVIPPHSGWDITVLFDDGTYGAEYGYGVKPSAYYDADYDLTLERNYDSEEVKSPEGYSECFGRRWTYTFTDADYEAAVKYGPRTTAE